MKRFKEEDVTYELNNTDTKKSNNTINENIGTSDEKNSHKRFEEEEKEDDYITPSMKNFRKLAGGLLLLSMVYYFVFSSSSGNTVYKSNLTSGKIEGIKAGDTISKEAVKLQPKDFAIDSANSYGNIELFIWNFADKEGGDYVQVFVNGSPKTEPFVIRHKPIKVRVPDKSVIQVRGIRDGSNNGITYGVFFNKTGETYLNTAPLNAANTYTLKTAQ